ncbi:hypothetical protein E2P81_ATG08625 [Venturia nashicola]|uniref:Uncharacterized protein n=1 Tax=Venturia nashicola TaxID=86259 RepID=A0A4Z1P0P7_9PEZI|nr:hypothetical protein E6O75_ATG08816 [Venturia nashicola]TLD20961.1 hypothetical protein E2P81_ATG08625 [Venturia nashicola]
MRSTIIAAALLLSVSAFPSPRYHDRSVADTLRDRAPQFNSLKGRRGSDDDVGDGVPAWIATIPKSSPKGSPRPLAGPSIPRNMVPLSMNSSPNRPPPKSAPWSPPKAQQSKPLKPPPPKEPPFPDAEEDDEKIKAVNRMQREPNAWELEG